VVEGRIDGAVRNLILPAPTDLFRSLRAYLQQRAERGAGQNVQDMIRLHRERNAAAITLGPSIDKGETDKHFLFPSGARLSFFLSLKAVEAGSRLIAYRYHLHLGSNARFEFLRFDLNKEQNANPLREPRCHIHLGTANVRVPAVVLDPFELLDCLFFVLEPGFR
jgi:hypothetical protein